MNGGIEFPGGLTPLELSRLPTFSFHENEDGKSGGEEGRVEEVRVDVVKLEIPGDVSFCRVFFHGCGISSIISAIF